VAWRVEWPTHEARLAGLNYLASLEARYDPRLRTFAVRVAGHAPPGRVGLARFGHEFVRDGVRFTGEGAETYADAYETLRTGVGDCDDSARALSALMQALGLQAKIVGLSRRAGRPPTHASVRINVGGRRPRWAWAETTIAARFGEHPYAAHARLRVKGREDI
jgi:transglutaminase-like putative cysteine protease